MRELYDYSPTRFQKTWDVTIESPHNTAILLIPAYPALSLVEEVQTILQSAVAAYIISRHYDGQYDNGAPHLNSEAIANRLK
ncbi:hypothetical protein I7I48_08048 [Histoplasma ohiense]|nr:hypothetical protein I7I48_08048 [Histoplasma ohiense (nom. inval.)]